MPDCFNIQKSLAWCQGTPEYAGVRRRIYYLAKSEIVGWATLERDERNGRAISAKYIGDFTLKADAKWKFIDILPDKSQLTSEPQANFRAKPNSTSWLRFTPAWARRLRLPPPTSTTPTMFLLYRT